MKPASPETRSQVGDGVSHYGFLDGLRAVLALYVVAHHAYLTLVDEGRTDLSPLFGVLHYGQLAVGFFIILSGFCLTLPVLKSDFRLKKGLADFFRRRAWRILPPYYFACFFSLLLIFLFIGQGAGKLWEGSLPITTTTYLTHLFLVHNFLPGQYHKINYVFWSIAVEWQIYFLFPLLLLSFRRVGVVITVAATVVMSLLLAQVINHRLHTEPCIDFIGLFALGMMAARVSFSTDAFATRMKALPWRWIAGLAFVATIFFYKSHVLESKLAFGIMGSSLLVVASLHRNGVVHRLLSLRPLVVIGSFSYSLYLVHAPLLAMLWKYPLASLQPSSNLACAALLIVGVPIIVLVSWLFYLCFERPFLRLRDRKPIAAAESPALPATLQGLVE